LNCALAVGILQVVQMPDTGHQGRPQVALVRFGSKRDPLNRESLASHLLGQLIVPQPNVTL
jgi:hypothetical protein